MREDQGLIGVVVVEDGHLATHVFTNANETDELPADAGTRAALEAIGAWPDLDWVEAVAELHQIRHQSAPTPPLDL